MAHALTFGVLVVAVHAIHTNLNQKRRPNQEEKEDPLMGWQRQRDEAELAYGYTKHKIGVTDDQYKQQHQGIWQLPSVTKTGVVEAPPAPYYQPDDILGTSQEEVQPQRSEEIAAHWFADLPPEVERASNPEVSEPAPRAEAFVPRADAFDHLIPQEQSQKDSAADCRGPLCVFAPKATTPEQHEPAVAAQPADPWPLIGTHKEAQPVPETPKQDIN